jgi:5S rRNA maturation endonuclease (ribonuclease M5)
MDDQLEAWLERLEAEQPWIIVEGPKDRKALVELGLRKVIVLRGRPLYEVVEAVAEKTGKVLILTDLDREGRELYGRLRQDLQKHGVAVDDRFRNFLFKETDLRQIEGFTKYLSKHRVKGQGT